MGLWALGEGRKARARPQKPPFRRKLLFEALEPRLLLSADLNPTEQHADAPLVQVAEPQQQSPVNMAAVLQLQAERRDIVFLDASLRAYRAQLGDANVVILDAARDGVAQITETLAGASDVGAVHIVTHGSGAGATLGNATLGASTIDSYAEQLATWQDALTRHLARQGRA